MSKYIKNLVSDHLAVRLNGVNDALLVNMVGLEVNANNRLRAELDEMNIQVMVIKNNLAARATAGTPLAPMFEGLVGPAAVCWGSEDIVSLARQVTRLADAADYGPFEPRGGIMDGESLTAEQVAEISKWPSRTEQLSILIGQILSPGANLASQLTGPASTLAGQIEQKAEEGGQEEEPCQ